MLSHDPGTRAAPEQRIETALSFAELSDEDAAAFRKRAVGETRVVRRRDGSYAFEQPERPPRRRWRWTDPLLHLFVADLGGPPDRRAEMRSRSAFVRLLGVLAAIWLLAHGSNVFNKAVAVVTHGRDAPIELGTAVLGVALGGIAALLLAAGPSALRLTPSARRDLACVGPDGERVVRQSLGRLEPARQVYKFKKTAGILGRELQPGVDDV